MLHKTDIANLKSKKSLNRDRYLTVKGDLKTIKAIGIIQGLDGQNPAKVFWTGFGYQVKIDGGLRLFTTTLEARIAYRRYQRSQA